MSDSGKKVFIDTNVLIYAYSSDEPEKRMVVQKLFSNGQIEKMISTQVINEFIQRRLTREPSGQATIFNGENLS